MVLTIREFFVNPPDRIIKDLNVRSKNYLEAQNNFLKTIEKIESYITAIFSFAIIGGVISLGLLGLSLYKFITFKKVIIPILFYGLSATGLGYLGKHMYDKSNKIKDNFKNTHSKTTRIKTVLKTAEYVYIATTLPILIWKYSSIFFNKSAAGPQINVAAGH
ncbi:MAG: hypothetical protein JXA94_04660 [Parachlamydiales bacterium]|nr:hypothetical protein [Parachlamydiales bacterium]